MELGEGMMDRGERRALAVRRVRLLVEQMRAADRSGDLEGWLDGCMGDGTSFMVTRDLDGNLRGIRVESTDGPRAWVDTMACEAAADTEDGSLVRVPLDGALMERVMRCAEYILG